MKLVYRPPLYFWPSGQKDVIELIGVMPGGMTPFLLPFFIRRVGYIESCLCVPLSSLLVSDCIDGNGQQRDYVLIGITAVPFLYVSSSETPHVLGSRLPMAYEGYTAFL